MLATLMGTSATATMREDAAVGAMSARIWFFVNDAIVLVLMFSTNNSLSRAARGAGLADGEGIGYVLAWLALGALSVALYIAIGALGPGFVDRAPLVRRRVRVRRMSQDGESAERPEPAAGAASSADLHYCKICHIRQPLRAKHCHQCRRCVHRFDHHCFWVSACVGERNHLVFFWFLCVQALLCAWTSCIAAEGLRESADGELATWLWLNGGLLVVLLDSTGLGLLPLGLAAYHAYLIVTGKTTWEDLKGSRISYLREFAFVNPFDEGALGNTVSFCCGPGAAVRFQPRVWRFLPAQLALARTRTSVEDVGVCDNMWRNRHYSCC